MSEFEDKPQDFKDPFLFCRSKTVEQTSYLCELVHEHHSFINDGAALPAAKHVYGPASPGMVSFYNTLKCQTSFIFGQRGVICERKTIHG